MAGSGRVRQGGQEGVPDIGAGQYCANKEEMFVRVLMERTPNAGPLMAARQAAAAVARSVWAAIR